MSGNNISEYEKTVIYHLSYFLLVFLFDFLLFASSNTMIAWLLYLFWASSLHSNSSLILYFYLNDALLLVI